ncbi:putative NAD-dependent epimerase/dehydratase, NAD(P)-binding domain superfamily [Helianthus annuus]|nr:putative NAD-dependent epimerase/dehydratase, NAD(P)-binding domain superfamily [Helianthus annuus]
MVNPELPSDMELDESFWTDIEYANSTQNWYAVSKTIAEMEALNFAKRHDVKVVTICPSIVIGPMLQSIINATSLLLLSYMKEEGRSGGDSMEDIKRPYVDVRDLCDAILLLYENPESNGRYICFCILTYDKGICCKNGELVPRLQLSQNVSSTSFTGQSAYPPLNSEKLLKLGWNYRPLEETIVDNIKNYEETGLLEKGKPFPSTITF